MREIKFAVLIAGNDKVKFAQFKEWLDGDGWKHDYYAPLVTNGVFYLSELGDGFLGEIIRRQYTGLKDKNGKEIYEGDIVAWDNHIMKGLSKISFYNGAFRLEDSPYEDYRVLETGERVKVVGNIYEAPELLK